MKLSFAQRLEIFRYAPPGRRLELARKISSALQQSPPTTPARYFDVGEFRNWEQLEIKYRQLAEELGYPGKIPAPGEIDFLHRMVDLDDVRYPGGIGSRDYFFLTCLVSILAPKRVIEIGTLTGFSSAIIAAAIYHRHGDRNAIAVETIDSQTYCLIDKSRPVGFEIPDLIPDLVSTVRIHPGRESDLVREIARPGEFGLAFIDADHRHPWPLIDVLRLAPFIESRGWVVLHDIQLGTHGETERAAGKHFGDSTPYGAEWFFERWPFRKIRSFHIGAIEVPKTLTALVPFALELIEQPFEVPRNAATRLRRAFYQALLDLF